MAQAKKNIYAVVLFLPRKSCDNLIDLIPCSWIIKTENDEVKYQYPARKDYEKLPQWLEQLKAPQKKWGYFKVEIIAYARK